MVVGSSVRRRSVMARSSRPDAAYVCCGRKSTDCSNSCPLQTVEEEREKGGKRRDRMICGSYFFVNDKWIPHIYFLIIIEPKRHVDATDQVNTTTLVKTLSKTAERVKLHLF